MLAQSAGSRGMSIVVVERDRELMFYIQARGVDIGDREKAIDQVLPFAIRLEENLRLRYCPS
jgi:hypothetical protein